MNYGAPLSNLKAAIADAGLTSVDVWIGTGGLPVAQLVVPVIQPQVYIPSHWDGLFNPFWDGIPFPYKDASLAGYLSAQGITLMPQRQYMDTYILSDSGVTMDANHDVKSELGFADEQPFDSAMQAAVSRVASTVHGDDCGENSISSPWAQTILKRLTDPSHSIF